MYQFPNSTTNENNTLHQSPTQTNKQTHLRAILIANVLLAIFVAGIVWFLFFFDTNTSSATSTFSVSNKNNQELSGTFTPIVINKNKDPIINSNKKNNDIQSIIKIETPEQKKITTEVKIALTSAATTSKKIEKISAIDAITRELEKNQQTKPALSLSHGRSLSTKKPLVKNSPAELNQVTIEKDTDIKLENLLVKNNESLSHSEHTLIKKLETIITPNTINNKKEKVSNSDIHNSISLQKSKDVDKIMAAMSSINKTPPTASVEKLENKVKHLLSNEKDKYRKTDQYAKALEPEAILNNNALRILTVKEGETIWDIAVRAYGDGNKYKKILSANPLIKNDPALLKTGITLRAPL